MIVPTFGRPAKIVELCRALARQTLAPERFEVVVVDDGSEEPVAGALPETPYALLALRQENSGPAAARNLALAHCRAPVCLILNDDARPADDLLAGHLAVHARLHAEKLAVLGTFRFTSEAVLASPFVELLDRTDLLFDFSALAHGRTLGWPWFWTCNISLPVEAIRAAGGFDAEGFRDIVEDVELGWRLERRGWRVLHRSDLKASHDHLWTIGAYFERARRLGRNLARMYAKHEDPTVLRLAPGTPLDERALRPMQSTCEALWSQLPRAIEVLEKIEVQSRGVPLPEALVAQLESLVRRVHAVPFYRGVLEELLGHDPEAVIEHGAAGGRLTSVIVVSCDSLAQTRACISALRRARDPRHEIEIVCVDNGSRDGSREWLAAQPDVLLIANEENQGAPRARNQAIARASGEYLVFLDNDAFVSPGWLARMLYHLEVDPLCACVGPLSDRAAHGQQIEYSGGSDPVAVEAIARRTALANPRGARHASLLSSFCLLVRRSLVDEIGGFDERFSPWGFEDDDFTLRASLSGPHGRHNRVALDVFVRHEGYRGRKLELHQGLLERNWERFRAKWGLPAGAAHGDYAALAPLFERGARLSELPIPIDSDAAGEGPAGEPARTKRCATS